MRQNMGASPLATGLAGADAPEPCGLGSSSGIPSADDFENDTQRGYAAWEAGNPFDEYQSAERMDGWKTADDFAWWKRLAAALGGSVHGFSHRYAGSLSIRGQIHSLEGTLLDAVVALLPASGMSAFGQDAEERLEAKPASPTAAGGDARHQ